MKFLGILIVAFVLAIFAEEEMFDRYLKIKYQGEIIQSFHFNKESESPAEYPVLFSEEQIGTVLLDRSRVYVENPYNDVEDYTYRVIAKKPDHYSLCIYLSEDSTEVIDYSQFELYPPYTNCGYIYPEMPDTDFYIFQDTTFISRIDTDDKSRFIYDFAPGDYFLSVDSCSWMAQSITFVSGYADYYYDSNWNSCDKPNIYLYPEEKIKIDVSIDFAVSGRIVLSDPEYGNGWKNLIVTPKGLINDKYTYLFYESANVIELQQETGWCVSKDNLAQFFAENLKQYGFNEKEIDDFLDFWPTRLNGYAFYNIYPQTTERINHFVTLNFSQKPDSLLRLFYYIEGVAAMTKLPEPTIPDFKREGFVATEWGVTLKNIEIDHRELAKTR